MKCMMCGEHELTTGDMGNFCGQCKEKLGKQIPDPPQPFYQPVPSFQYGWMCPKCGAVYAPFMNECTRCNPFQEMKVTCLNEGGSC